MRQRLNAFTGSFALHLFALVALVWISAADVRERARAAANPPPKVSVAPSLEPADAATRDWAAREARKDAQDRLRLSEDTGSQQIEMPNFRFDFSKVRARATTLFPFLTDGLSLEAVRQIAERAQDTRLPNPYARASASSSLPPLAISDAALQSLVDKAWSRRERWSVFQPIAELTTRYSPSDGRLPALLRRYLQQNLLQPYTESHLRDPRLWIMLGITADHSDFIEFVTQYAARHPSTRATTELLFMLDDMAQGSRDASTTLLDIDTERELWWTVNTNKDAHRLVEALQILYRKKLEARRIHSAEGIAVHYDSVRLSILQAIVADTPRGYRESDARLPDWVDLLEARPR